MALPRQQSQSLDEVTLLKVTASPSVREDRGALTPERQLPVRWLSSPFVLSPLRQQTRVSALYLRRPLSSVLCSRLSQRLVLFFRGHSGSGYPSQKSSFTQSALGFVLPNVAQDNKGADEAAVRNLRAPAVRFLLLVEAPEAIS